MHYKVESETIDIRHRHYPSDIRDNPQIKQTRTTLLIILNVCMIWLIKILISAFCQYTLQRERIYGELYIDLGFLILTLLYGLTLIAVYRCSLLGLAICRFLLIILSIAMIVGLVWYIIVVLGSLLISDGRNPELKLILIIIGIVGALLLTALLILSITIAGYTLRLGRLIKEKEFQFN